VKQLASAFSVILLLAISVASCESGSLSFKTKKQKAREATEALAGC
jgi:hypothetical protein